MPYNDPQKRRDYSREYARLHRGGVCQTPSQTQLPAEFRLKTARDVLDLIAEQVQAVRAEQEAGTLEKARTIGYLAGIALKAVEVADLADRLEAVEKVLKGRKDSESCNEQDWPANTIN
jgi:hypothetical protein